MKTLGLIPIGKSTLPILVLPFVFAEDLSNYCSYLKCEHKVGEKELERHLRIADYVKLESRIFNGLHDLSSLPSRADRVPLLKQLEIPNRLHRYFEPNATLDRIEDSELLLSFYGLYESPKLGGIRMFLLPDASSQKGVHRGDIVVLATRRPKSTGKFFVSKQNGKVTLKREGCEKQFKLLWNEDTKAFDLMVNSQFIFKRRTPCFLNEQA